MSTRRRAGLKRPIALVLAGVTLTAITLSASTGAEAAASGPTETYIVQITGDPLATYTGTESGYAATKPAKGSKFNAHSKAADAYSGHLRSRQKDVLAKAGVDSNKIVYQYDTTFNGVAVQLTAGQAAKLQGSGSVVQIWKNRTVTIKTPPTDQFLGLTGPNGVWKQVFGSDKKAGAGVIIGDIDTGFWPESPSFAPIQTTPSEDAVIAAKWHGSCDTASGAGTSAAVTCNNKVIGAQWFNAAGLASANPGEFKSPRDFDGHGSHTASTAAGDYVAHATINGVDAGDVEGVAPGARLAVYKVLYERADNSTASGSSADIVAAINKAVADGVDVINYSVGDDVDTFGPEELAFFNAASAGVFVSAAAGNAGPGASTVDNAMPFETTVAAGTYDQSWSKTVTLGNGAKYTGVGVGAAVPSAPLIDSVNAGKAGADPTQVELCFSGTLDPAKVTGKIVLCERGTNDRIDKSRAVQQAGGVGAILYNPSANSLNADFHFVPTVHVDQTAGAAIKAYIAGTASPTASLSVGTAVSVEAPAVASFSSRGPSISSGGSVLKPDIMAPGNDVVAAVSPAHHNGNLYDTESGTSMATPHIAGVAALLISKHPNWSPMAVKSAMLTTATTVDNKGKPIQGQDGAATPLDYGSGEVVPADAFNPGLVYDSGQVEWIQYLCGLGGIVGASTCAALGTVAPEQFNSPNIAVGDLTGKITVSRTVTNVTADRGIYNAKVDAPKGFKVTVSPSHLDLKPGASATFKVTIERTNKAPLDTYAFGSLTWVSPAGHGKGSGSSDCRPGTGHLTGPQPDGKPGKGNPGKEQPYEVKSVIAVNPVAVSVPGSFTGTGVSGSQALTVSTGYAGTLTTSVAGLVSGTEHDFNLVTDVAGFDPNHPATSAGVGSFEAVVPDDALIARFATYAADYPAGTDLDVWVYQKQSNGTLALYDFSAGSTAEESVTLSDPGDYVIFVDAFALPADPTVVKAFDYLVSGSTGPAGNFTATPASQSATLAGSATVTLGWTGLTAGKHYLGAVFYGDGTNTVGTTLVQIDA